MAHGGLGHAEAFRGGTHVASGVDRLEGLKQIEVGAHAILQMNKLYKDYDMDR
jgi:hypothetical protein